MWYKFTTKPEEVDEVKHIYANLQASDTDGLVLQLRERGYGVVTISSQGVLCVWGKGGRERLFSRHLRNLNSGET